MSSNNLIAVTLFLFMLINVQSGRKETLRNVERGREGMYVEGKEDGKRPRAANKQRNKRKMSV